MTDKIVLSRTMYDQARAAKQNISQFLEQKYPTPEGEKLDAFQRALKQEGIFTKSIYDKGISASDVEAFYRTEESRFLFPEYIARSVREAIVQDTMLPYLVGVFTTIDSDTYRTFYVDDQPAKQKKKRVTEAAELPRVKITGRDQVVKIYKFGRAIEASYEVLRRMKIDMLALHLRRMAMQVAKDKVEEIINVIVNGDGNNNAAPVIKSSVLVGSATTLTAEVFLRFLMEFEEFPCNTIIADKAGFINIVLAELPSLSTADVLKILAQGTSVGINLTAPQMPSGAVRLFWHKDVGAKKIIGINNQFAIEQVTEAGSDIYEAGKFIERQTEILTLSETNGYAKVFNEATKVLHLA